MSNLLTKAVSLVHDGDRYYGHGRFFHEFIDDWAFQQTGLYEPPRPLNKKAETIASELSQVIREAWGTSPGEDFMGHLIEECGGSGHLSFFRTPPSVSLLMAKLMGGSRKLEDFADICMGSGSLTLAYIHQTFLDGGASAVSRLNIHGEELSGSKVKVAMLQILNLLDILGGGTPLYVHSMKLSEINSLSREQGTILYQFSGPNNPDCRLSKKQRQQIEHAIQLGVPETEISLRFHVPVSLVMREQHKHHGLKTPYI